MPGGTVTQFWVFLDISEHIYLVSGPFPARPPSFLDRFFKPPGPFLTLFQAASTSPRVSFDPPPLQAPTVYIHCTYTYIGIYRPLAAGGGAPLVGGGGGITTFFWRAWEEEKTQNFRFSFFYWLKTGFYNFRHYFWFLTSFSIFFIFMTPFSLVRKVLHGAVGPPRGWLLMSSPCSAAWW